MPSGSINKPSTYALSNQHVVIIVAWCSAGLNLHCRTALTVRSPKMCCIRYRMQVDLWSQEEMSLG